ncbi:MAG: hypothetical protein SWQ30_18595 [Thermodesulfobacteriota bacterium]|nr:hypothetical protein [Thermodesulfobacteriota bacterium]
MQDRNKVVIATKFGIYMKEGGRCRTGNWPRFGNPSRGPTNALVWIPSIIDLYYQRVVIDMPISDLPRLSQLVEHHVYGGVYVS